MLHLKRKKVGHPYEMRDMGFRSTMSEKDWGVVTDKKNMTQHYELLEEPVQFQTAS